MVARFSFYLLCIALVVGLCSCGFKPVYGKKIVNQEMVDRLETVKVKPINTILGQEYVMALSDALNPGAVSREPSYIIEASVKDSVQSLVVERNRTVTRYKVVIFVDYVLKDIASGGQIIKGTIKNEADYDKVSSDYATYVAEVETKKRAIRELANDTKLRIMTAIAEQK